MTLQSGQVYVKSGHVNVRMQNVTLTTGYISDVGARECNNGARDTEVGAG